MFLTHLSLTNFRSFARLDLEIPRRVVLLTGSNAQGKTTLLEAVYFLATFTSFQTHADRQLVNFFEARKELAVGRLVAEYTRGHAKHHLEVRLVLEGVGVSGQRLRKEILLDGIKRPLSEVIGHFSAVMFVPQMVQIIEGGPEERRRTLNLVVAQTVPGYAHLLGEYGRTLSQRNALLKLLGERGGDQTQLDFWDESITQSGAAIIYQRIQAVHEIEKHAVRIHSKLTNGSEVFRIHYQPAYDPLSPPTGQIVLPLNTSVERNGLTEEDIRQGYHAALKANRVEEIRRGVTMLGPHRDELRFIANGIDLTNFGSRGQVRTTLLSIKLAEIEWMKSRTGQWPVLLLDEVLAELDAQRRNDLLTYLEHMDQALLTTTDLKLFSSEFVKKAELWEVASGTVKVNADGKEG
jgi:DNA replication and repair protein RecF